ncbi:hypothetical protein B0H10DRAFT_1954164 [Mycena sp. CBHHK59/15]|nr:hypothetical protein B0H10DRAFT_1954164 [Mycena sp. CBHHK59/15]
MQRALVIGTREKDLGEGLIVAGLNSSRVWWGQGFVTYGEGMERAVVAAMQCNDLEADADSSLEICDRLGHLQRVTSRKKQGHSDGSMEEAVGQWWGKGRKYLADNYQKVFFLMWCWLTKSLEMQGIRWKLWEEEAKNYCSWLSVSEALGWPLPWKSEHQDSVGGGWAENTRE